MGTKSAAGLLTSVDSMFTTQEERDNAQRSYLTDLPTSEISDFPDHPFKVRMDESMTELADSVKERGVLHPDFVGWISIDGTNINYPVILEKFPLFCPKCKHESLLYANGVSLKDIQEWLGHSDISTASNIYISVQR